METATTTYKGYRISATYQGNKVAPWVGDGYSNSNNHIVTVTNTTTKKRIRFEFWASIASPELRKRSDLLDAFRCFLSDAISGLNSFEEFCSEYGYDTDSRKAESIWKSCIRAAKKAERVLSDGEDIYNLINSLPD